MTLCADCPSTSSPPPMCPEAPDGSNCCLRIRYTCIDGTWTLDTGYTECVDNTECSAFSQTCTDTEFTYEMQNGCLCFALPDPICDPLDVGCDCTTTTTTTTTTSTTTTSTTSTTSTTTTTSSTTTTPPPACPDSINGSWDFDVTANVEISPFFDLRLPGGTNCCYRVDINYTGTVGDGPTACPGPQVAVATLAGGFDPTPPVAAFHAGSCAGALTALTQSFSPGGSFNVNQTVYLCGNSPLQWVAVSGCSVTGGGPRVQGTVSWTVTLEVDPCA